MLDEYECLSHAYGILGRLAQEAWANPQEVPLPVARILLHARDYIGRQLSAQLIEENNGLSSRCVEEHLDRSAQSRPIASEFAQDSMYP
jgi:hypothetical protein